MSRDLCSVSPQMDRMCRVLSDNSVIVKASCTSKRVLCGRVPPSECMNEFASDLCRTRVIPLCMRWPPAETFRRYGLLDYLLEFLTERLPSHFFAQFWPLLPLTSVSSSSIVGAFAWYLCVQKSITERRC